MITRRKLFAGALHRKQQESSSKTGIVSSLVPSTQSNYGKVAARNHAEISQKVVNISIPCTENAQQPMAAPTLLSLIPIGLMVKCHPCTQLLLGKKTDMENHCARVLTMQVWRSPMTYFSYNIKPVQCY